MMLCKLIRVSGIISTFLFLSSCTDFHEEEVPVRFGVGTQALVFGKSAASLPLTVSSGTKWSVASVPEWVGVKSIDRSARSPYEWDVTFSVTANDEYNREGVIVLKAGGDESQVNVTQEGEKEDFVSVDLGLSVRCASCNVGATKPEDYGDYFAWGETEPYYSSKNPLTWKDGKGIGYVWASYSWCYGSSNTLKKYNTGLYGTIDNKTEFKDYDYDDDAARTNWGGKWRMPTDAEWKELIENSSWTWITLNGVNGRLVTGKNGNSIFLPAAGYRGNVVLNYSESYGFYWSSSLFESSPSFARDVGFSSSEISRHYGNRYCGQSVRPVTEWK